MSRSTARKVARVTLSERRSPVANNRMCHASNKISFLNRFHSFLNSDSTDEMSDYDGPANVLQKEQIEPPSTSSVQN